MSEDKGGEYTKRLSQELKSSLYQRGDPDHQLWNGDMPPPDLQVGSQKTIVGMFWPISKGTFFFAKLGVILRDGTSLGDFS